MKIGQYVVGYVRLSRDDDRKNYASIENQKMIITNYAKERGMEVNEFFEDDGVSGYLFDRPAFNLLRERLDKDIDTVIVKDFSRLGRHNAKVLLLLDEFQTKEKQLIAIDDNYDSFSSDDDIIGIKTWYNERYVKDTSKKIRRVLDEKQKSGKLLINAPFGYYIDKVKNENVIKVIDDEAQIVKKIFNLYVNGNGYRNIANILNNEEIPCPTLMMSQREIKSKSIPYNRATLAWSEDTIKEIIRNDFYIGTLRLKKRTRKTVHALPTRISRNDQAIFPNNHEPIIEYDIFQLAQDIKARRSYGTGGYKPSISKSRLFSDVIFCSDCGAKLSSTSRIYENGKIRQYYICSTYNRKGIKYCQKSHIIDEDILIDDFIIFIKMSIKQIEDQINKLSPESKNENEINVLINRKQLLENKILSSKSQLKTLLSQKIKEMALSVGNESIVNETYSELQNDIVKNVNRLEKELEQIKISIDNVQNREEISKFEALNIMKNVLGKNREFSISDINGLVCRVEVNSDGIPEFTLKYGISSHININMRKILNEKENNIISTVKKIILEDKRGYTSARYISTKITELGIKKSKYSIMPYIKLMIEAGILEATNDPIKPYKILSYDN